MDYLSKHVKAITDDLLAQKRLRDACRFVASAGCGVPVGDYFTARRLVLSQLKDELAVGDVRWALCEFCDERDARFVSNVEACAFCGCTDMRAVGLAQPRLGASDKLGATPEFAVGRQSSCCGSQHGRYLHALSRERVGGRALPWRQPWHRPVVPFAARSNLRSNRLLPEPDDLEAQRIPDGAIATLGKSDASALIGVAVSASDPPGDDGLAVPPDDPERIRPCRGPPPAPSGAIGHARLPVSARRGSHDSLLSQGDPRHGARVGKGCVAGVRVR